jgi:hypothetical protein
VFLQRFQRELQNKQVSLGLKAHKLVDLLEDVFSRTYLYCRQLALILECFVPFGFARQSVYFGSYRTELVVSLFPRLLDLHNFEMVLEVLSPYEVAAVICRVGYLAVFNPCKPEGSFELDLGRPEERFVVKLLVILGIFEPGNNFINESFRWAKDQDSMPGWELVRNFFFFLQIIERNKIS